MISPSSRSFGEPFNAAEGGVFAMLWDSAGLHFCKLYTGKRLCVRKTKSTQQFDLRRGMVARSNSGGC